MIQWLFCKLNTNEIYSMLYNCNKYMINLVWNAILISWRENLKTLDSQKIKSKKFLDGLSKTIKKKKLIKKDSKRINKSSVT